MYSKGRAHVNAAKVCQKDFTGTEQNNATDHKNVPAEISTG